MVLKINLSYLDIFIKFTAVSQLWKLKKLMYLTFYLNSIILNFLPVAEFIC